jgi:hypothetical protein
VNPLREQQEYAVQEAARRERDAWAALERIARRDSTDDETRRAHRERWQDAAQALVNALRALKH